MGSTDPGGERPAIPVENTVRALRRLAPGACLREPRSPELRELARTLRAASPASLARTHPRLVGSVVLAHQLRSLGRTMTGLFGADGPESARLVRAARFSGTWRAGRRAGPLLDRLRAEPGLRAAALGWAEVTGCWLLAAELRGAAVVPADEDGLLAAELTVAAVLPQPDFGDCGPGGGAAPSGMAEPSSLVRSAFLDVRSLQVGATGFRVDVEADTPVELAQDGSALTLRALWWKGLGRVTDDLGHEYLILAKDPAGTGIVRHWCHPRPAPDASVLRLESAGYRGERLRLDPASPGTSAEVLVKLELTVRLGA